MIKALEHRGTIILANEPIPIEEAWFIVKSKNGGANRVDNDVMTENYAAIWSAKSTYGCTYAPEVEAKLAEMSSQMYVKSAHRSF